MNIHISTETFLDPVLAYRNFSNRSLKIIPRNPSIHPSRWNWESPVGWNLGFASFTISCLELTPPGSKRWGRSCKPGGLSRAIKTFEGTRGRISVHFSSGNKHRPWTRRRRRRKRRRRKRERAMATGSREEERQWKRRTYNSETFSFVTSLRLDSRELDRSALTCNLPLLCATRFHSGFVIF